MDLGVIIFLSQPADITIVKSMKSPPSGVKLVMAAVCVMKDIKPDKVNDPDKPGQKILDYWGPSKKLLGDMSFLSMLKEYDKDNIPVSIIFIVLHIFIQWIQQNLGNRHSLYVPTPCKTGQDKDNAFTYM